MSRRRHTPHALLLAVVLLAVLVFAHGAFTASNVTPATRAGDGAQTISGYNVNNVRYTLAANPSTLQTVQFQINAAPRQIRVTFGAPAGTWFTCTRVGANATCALGGTVPVSASGSFRVVATS